MKVRTTVIRAEQQLRAEMIDGNTNNIESRIAYAVEQALKWTRTHGKGESPLEIARAQAKLLNAEIETRVRMAVNREAA